MTAVMLSPAANVFAAVAVAVAGVDDDTATADRPVTVVPLTLMATLKLPLPVKYLSVLMVPPYGMSHHQTVSSLTVAAFCHCAWSLAKLRGAGMATVLVAGTHWVDVPSS